MSLKLLKKTEKLIGINQQLLERKDIQFEFNILMLIIFSVWRNILKENL